MCHLDPHAFCHVSGTRIPDGFFVSFFLRAIVRSSGWEQSNLAAGTGMPVMLKLMLEIKLGAATTMTRSNDNDAYSSQANHLHTLLDCLFACLLADIQLHLRHA